MKVVILAGGFGTRLAEETVKIPKPMVEIGGRPIIWHIMMHYSHFGFNDFLIALGYKGEVIKEYMLHYCSMHCNLTVNLRNGKVIMHNELKIDWVVNLIDTGYNTMTGGRVKRLAPYIGDKPFMLTYGDGVSNINLNNLLSFHQSHGKLATITAVRPSARFGYLELDDNKVSEFSEKVHTKEGWINGGFFVLEPEVLNFIKDDDTVFEKEPLQNLAKSGQLMAYQHDSFWQCMDTLREKNLLESMWQSGNAPWAMWRGEGAIGY
jgi:glucose-1-phosphate cytidylyltransferase